MQKEAYDSPPLLHPPKRLGWGGKINNTWIETKKAEHDYLLRNTMLGFVSTNVAV